MSRVSIGDTIQIDNDMWADHTKLFTVLSCTYKNNTTAVDLILEDKDSNIFTRTLASNQIIKV